MRNIFNIFPNRKAVQSWFLNYVQCKHKLLNVSKKKKKKNITKQYWHTVSLEYMWKNCILLQLTGEGTETQSARLIYRGI